MCVVRPLSGLASCASKTTRHEELDNFVGELPLWYRTDPLSGEVLYFHRIQGVRLCFRSRPRRVWLRGFVSPSATLQQFLSFGQDPMAVALAVPGAARTTSPIQHM